MSSRSIVLSSSQSCFAFALLCGFAGCNVYSPDLMNRSAVSSGGTDSNGGSAVDNTGGTAGLSNTSGASSEAGSSAGGAAEAGAGAVQGGNGGSVSAGATGMAGSAASGAGTAGTGGAGASTLDLIDNLEDGDGLIRLVNTPRRDGIWDSGNDSTSGGKQTPVPGMFKPIALLAADAPYAGDKYAAYSKATGFASYAFMNVSMRSWATYDTTYPKYDASGYKGLTFLAKAGTGSSLGMRVRFISGDTDPRGAKCKLSTDTPTPPANELCYNHYYAPVTLTNDWATYTLSFADDFLQPVVTSSAIDVTELYGFEFYFGGGDDYEIWVDDLSFVKN